MKKYNIREKNSVLCVYYVCHHFYISHCHIDAELYSIHTHYAHDLNYTLRMALIIYFIIATLNNSSWLVWMLFMRVSFSVSFCSLLFLLSLFLSIIHQSPSFLFTLNQLLKHGQIEKEEGERKRKRHLQSQTLSCDGYDNPMTLVIKWWQTK